MSKCEVPEVSPDVRCPTGEARITPGFKLRARHVIHTVGPVYRDAATSAPLLAAAYRSSLQLALQHKLRSVAFPAISTGVYGYPAGQAAQVSLQTVAETLAVAAGKGKGGAASPEEVAVEVPGSGSESGSAAGVGCSVREVRFVLFGQALYDAYVRAAESMGLKPAAEGKAGDRGGEL